jgi:gluconate 2-dehydrogenase gamma chain
MADELIARRTALKYFGFLSSTAAGRHFLASWLPSPTAALPQDKAAKHGHHPSPAAPKPAKFYVAQFFKPAEFETVEILTEMIIPADDKPGAKDARVAAYIDFVVFSAAEHQPSLQREWSDGLALLDQTSQEKYGHSFQRIRAAERENLLLEMSFPERDPNARHPGFTFYRLVKEMTVEGFYTSRPGLLEALDYKGLDFLSEFPGCTHPEHRG